MMEAVSVVMLAYIVSSSAPLNVRLLAIMVMILPGLVSGICRFEYCKSHVKLAAGVLLLHLVEALLALVSVLLSSSIGRGPADDTQQLLLYGSLLAGACLLAVDSAALLHAVARRAADAALEVKMSRPETPPAIHRLRCDGRTYRQEELQEEGEEAETCVICLQDLELGEEVGELACCHRFHFSCLDAWIKSRSHPPWCPLRCSNASSSEKQQQQQLEP